MICRPSRNRRWCSISSRHRKIYDTRLARERQKVLGLLGDWEKNRFQVFPFAQPAASAQPARRARRRIAPRVSSSVDYLTEQLPEAGRRNTNALVFSQFTRFLHILTAHLDRWVSLQLPRRVDECRRTCRRRAAVHFGETRCS